MGKKVSFIRRDPCNPVGDNLERVFKIEGMLRESHLMVNKHLQYHTEVVFA